jgi:hypothetical protein
MVLLLSVGIDFLGFQVLGQDMEKSLPFTFL